jgi:hypothetical protein
MFFTAPSTGQDCNPKPRLASSNGICIFHGSFAQKHMPAIPLMSSSGRTGFSLSGFDFQERGKIQKKTG